MNILRLVPSLILVCMLTAPAWAADDVLPPPTVTAESSTSASQSLPAERAPDMRDEMKKPDDTSAVDIRSYQRKDGATITEYGVRGRVFKIKVQPSNGMPAYYLYREPDGQFVRRLPGGAKGISPPNWILKEF